MSERHPISECDRLLRAQPDYSPFRATPETFDCSCGRRWAHVHDEAEGDFYAEVENAEDAPRG